MLASLLSPRTESLFSFLKFVSNQPSHESANNEEKKIFIQLWGQFVIRSLEHRFLKLGFIITSIAQEHLFSRIFSDVNVAF